MTVQPATSVRRDRGTQLLLLVAALVAVAGIAFAGGRLTAPPAASAANRTFGNGAFGNGAGFAGGTNEGGTGGAGFGRGAFGGGGVGAAIQGTVSSVSGSSLDLKLANGTTVTVNLGPSTTYHTETTASASAVAVGGQVLVRIERQAGATPAPSGAPRTFSASDVTVVAP